MPSLQILVKLLMILQADLGWQRDFKCMGIQSMLDLEAHTADLWKATQLPAAFPGFQVVLICTCQLKRFCSTRIVNDFNANNLDACS